MRREGETRGGWKIVEALRVGRISPSGRRESVRPGDLVAVAVGVSRIAHAPALRIGGGAGETGIAGRLEQIGPAQGLGPRGRGIPATPAVAGSTPGPDVSRSIPDPDPDPVDSEIVAA